MYKLIINFINNINYIFIKLYVILFFFGHSMLLLHEKHNTLNLVFFKVIQIKSRRNS